MEEKVKPAKRLANILKEVIFEWKMIFSTRKWHHLVKEKQQGKGAKIFRKYENGQKT